LLGKEIIWFDFLTYLSQFSPFSYLYR